ncbi:AraC family transcriptional regulator [Amycolatopsis jiangsuensis]|uniref:AraC-like DNA-binding protein n=1 Tax=Amycolatopsis jiangsuensis TaxID=1181879 RepID=A0A840J333_9PSEU|nr:AraC family transcriptional regulator [Amycolatopsis jiangsuensis]MBB4688470.1 AraC-like DNA-binding protein [Amycolatopsis jiangsuensis]
MDLLSDAIAVMRTGEPASNRMCVGTEWSYRFASYAGAGFHVLLRGSGWLLTERGGPVRLGPGDAVLLPHGSAHVLSSTPDDRRAVPFETAVAQPGGTTDVLCGKYRFDRSRAHFLMSALPEVIHLPAEIGTHPELRAAISLLGNEVHGTRPGRDAAVGGLLDLLLAYLIRAWLAENSADGWPKALHDKEIAAALEALHADPARPWQLAELAAEVGLSRATLARRFTALTGRPPMAYLTWWRMTTAAQLLRDSERALPAIARRVGYSSPFAFSHAFKRQFGVAPALYRSAVEHGSGEELLRDGEGVDESARVRA